MSSSTEMMFIAYGFQVILPLKRLTIDSVLKLLGDLPVDIPGGEIIRDPGLGVLCDTAATLVEEISPIKTEEERTATLKLAMKDLNSVGLVGVHEAGVYPENIELYQKLQHFDHNLTVDWSMLASCPCEYTQWQIIHPKTDSSEIKFPV